MIRITCIGMAIAVALSTAVASAQAPHHMSKDCGPPVGVAARTGVFNVALNSPAEVVEDAPYYGVGTTEMVNTLADGNRIVQKNTMRYYRDSAGRTRTEYQLAAVGPFTLDEKRS